MIDAALLNLLLIMNLKFKELKYYVYYFLNYFYRFLEREKKG